MKSNKKKVPICGFTTDKATKEEFFKYEISLKVADQRKFLAKSVVCLNSVILLILKLLTLKFLSLS